MSQVKVILDGGGSSEPGNPSGSGSLAVPNTGGINSSDVGGGVLGGSLVMLLIVVGLIVGVVVFRKMKKNESRVFDNIRTYKHMKLGHNRRMLFAGLSLLVVSGLILAIVITKNEELGLVTADSNSLSVTASDVELKVRQSEGGTFAYAKSEVTVTVDAQYGGYDLSVYTDNKDLVNNEDSSAVIGRVNKKGVLDNTWGVTTTKPNDASQAVWQSVAEQSEGLTSLGSGLTSEPTKEIYYGIKVNTELPDGEYVGTVVYVATAKNPIPTTGTYTIQYNANGGEGPATFDQTATVGQSVKLSSNQRMFTREGYSFDGWNTKADGSGTQYTAGQSVNISATAGATIVLYAQWKANTPTPAACPAGHICYDDNGANSVTKMREQEVVTSNVVLWASNFQRANYGFAGWNTKADGTGDSYGPNETISVGNLASAGLRLYAIWVEKAGDLQNWSGCSSLGQGKVTALRDTRDGNVYAVAKLADGNCWMIENLRLDSTANITSNNTDNPASGFVLSSSVNLGNGEWCADYSCRDQSMLYNGNTVAPVGNMTGADANVYGYGNYYNWYSATAGNGVFDTPSGDSVVGSICPIGWQLPIGGGGNENTSKSFQHLDIALGGDGDDHSPAFRVWRSYPNNFVVSGYIPRYSIYSRGTQGYYWSSTASSTTDTRSHAYHLVLDQTYIYPGVASSPQTKHSGFTVRCVAGS